VGGDKLVPALGSRGKLPVEVVPFALGAVTRRLGELGLRGELRRKDGEPFRSDNGNLILDCALTPPSDPAALDRALHAIPGLVDTGFFLGMAALVLVDRGDGTIDTLRRG